MRTVALISGGKDSCYNMLQCVGAGHTIVALANLQPLHKDEMDSYMYQTVGHHGINLYAEAMGLPLYRETISGSAVDQGKNYIPTDNDEVEDLYRLLSRIKLAGIESVLRHLLSRRRGNNKPSTIFSLKKSIIDVVPDKNIGCASSAIAGNDEIMERLPENELDIEAVAVGAILSDYQRVRVENVCRRLGLVSLAYLWRRNQKELLQEMISNGIEAIIIKVAALGLDPRVHLGMSLRDIQPHLLVMQEKYGLNVCGEGGEYETFTLDCPLFRKRLVIDDKELVIHTDDPVAPVGYLNLKLHLETKENYDDKLPPIKNALDYVGDLSDTVFSDISDIELSETELESIEKLEKEEKLKLEKEKNELNPLLTYSGDKVETSSVDIDGRNDSLESLEEGYIYESHNESERHPVLDHRSIYGNKHGWYFIGGIVGEGVDTRIATQDAMKKLINLLSAQNLQLPDVCSVNIYMRDMEQYAALNDVYVSTFSFSNPPTRVCVQVPLPENVGLILDAVAHKFPANDYDETDVKERITMHVQGISHWAPANIGPYSQAVKVGEVIGTCGQIALVPGSMQLAGGGARRQCALALRHLTRVIRAVNPRAHIRSVVQSVCYVTQGSAVNEARRQLERRTAGAIVQYAVVTALPRQASVEWHAWAHAHNNRFEYEETGCNVGEYKVAITRRWNYENTVAAFVCYVATVENEIAESGKTEDLKLCVDGSSPSTCQLSFPSEEACSSHRALASHMCQADLEEVLEYALNKLTSECRDNAAPAVKMRIFYQVWSAPPPHVITGAVEAVRARVRVRAAATAVPVLALHNAFTFLSISGLRLDE